MRMRIEAGRALVGGSLEETSVDLDCEAGVITGVGAQASAERAIDARGLLVLPGIVDIHGDAFERQMMPRPGVGFPIDVALLESDRQAVANGITTVFHGVTWSCEGGLRGVENARAVLDGIARLRPRLGADTRYHLRHETYNQIAITRIGLSLWEFSRPSVARVCSVSAGSPPVRFRRGGFQIP
jgi:alpha-D-ribose 1-methylphosphonate 5-triphosphate diphosphatase